MALRFIGSLILRLAVVASSAANAATNALPPALQQPMRFQLVKFDDPRCEPDCPEWISAEGKIELGTGAVFARFVAGLGGRRLPLLINSPGGSITDAIQMGHLIRSRNMVVAVAKTALLPCAQPKGCGEPRAVAEDWLALCASACPFVLAGGVERYAGPGAAIGVHRAWRVMTQTKIYRSYRVEYRIQNGHKEEISRTVTGESRKTSTSTQTMTAEDDARYSAYLAEMGVGHSLMNIMESTPSDSMSWQTPIEAQANNLITMKTDMHFPIRADGGNGLSGEPYDPNQHKPVVEARLLKIWSGPELTFDALFSHLPGGGRIQANVMASGPGPFTKGAWNGVAADLWLSFSTSQREFRLPAVRYGEYRRVAIPTEVFCTIGKGAAITIRTAGLAGVEGDPRMVLTAKDSEFAPLLAEACPGVAVR